MSNAGSNDQVRRALGKGLSALLPQRSAGSPHTQQQPKEATPQQSGILAIPIAEIDPNPLQPRSVFRPEQLGELAQSIRENGIVQPLIVRRSGDRYQLIAGERRLRAAKLASLDVVPAVVQDYTDERVQVVTLIENIQREDLNPIEVAHAFERLVKNLNLSHEQVAQRTGKDRTTITNMLRLLRLPEDVQILLAEHRLSMGHARAILGLPTPELQLQVAQRVASEGLSVRQVERLVQKMVEPREAKPPDEIVQDPNVKAAAQDMERVLGTRVRIIEKSEHRGRIEIDYYSSEELHRIYEHIVGGG